MRTYLLFSSLMIILVMLCLYFLLVPVQQEGAGKGISPGPVESSTRERAAVEKGVEEKREGYGSPRPDPDPREPPREKLKLACKVEITGRFLDVHGKPIPSVEVEIENEAATLTARSGRDGSFEALLPDYPLSTFSAVMKARKIDYATHHQTLVYPADQPIDLGFIVLERGGTVTGWVVDQEGRPLSGARVFYRKDKNLTPTIEQLLWKHTGPPGPRPGETLTASDGSFRMKGVPVGRFRIWAGAEFMMYDHTYLPVEVAAGRETSGIQLKIRPVPSGDLMKGQILSPEGEPLAGVEVVAYLRLAGRKPGGSLRKVHTLITDEEGAFRFVRHLESRWYDLDIRDPSGRYKSMRVTKVKGGSGVVQIPFLESN